DHVYLAAESNYESFYIGRVDSRSPSNLFVAIAWYQRPSEVSDGRSRSQDPRLVVATMHSDVNPVSTIRGKCVVTHAYHILEALAVYTSLPDHFYFTQLFDRFVGRNYDVVPCEKVLNVPDNIAQALRDRYRYIIVEPTKTSELTDSHRSCKVCTQWCPPNESMRCEMCGYYYHMGCLDPPLATKPGKGYVWQCVSCLKQMAQQRMGNQGDNPRLRTRSQPAPKPVGTDMGRSSSQQIRSTSSTVRPTSATSATVP
ncbi:hypothetical protein BJ085DRAFT_6854, partial [Dimargaris cristalligena]